jgi:alpha-N-arabinofuranosidase
MRMLYYLCVLAIGAMATTSASAQANLPIYTDNLVNGFQDWSWVPRSLTNTSPVHSGANSISATGVGTAYQALSFEHPDFNATIYASLGFWAHGGTSGGQKLQVYAQYGSSGQGAGYPLSALPANAWQQYVIPLTLLGVANATNVNRFSIQLTPNGTTNTFFVDDIELTAKPAPVAVHISLNATQTLRAVDARWFGVNTATWDGNLGAPQTLSLLQEMGCQALRFPGGSTSDAYHWAADSTGNSRFRNNATNLGAQVFITVNYGSGSSNEAAGWVRSANITNHCGFKYWEIGNECYGSWETDTNAQPHDPYTYAVRTAGYLQLMKAADPTIKIGVVVVTGEDAYANNTLHPAVNPRTGQTHNGWTPVLLTTLKNIGVTPDFAIYHYYPEYTQPPPPNPPPIADSDPFLLQVSANWASDAADLRQQISDYFGSAGTNIELVCTENNSDASSAFGRQLTSLVNGLYLADSVSQLMKTEFNAYLWWDLRNGHDSSGTFDPTIYGWRTYGDEGIIDGLSGRYPTFYAEKLLQYFARPGDAVLNATSDYLLLSTYAVRKASGALTLLVINKDSAANFNGQISLSNFLPSPTAVLRSYGIPQDEATRTNGTAQAQDIATNTIPNAGASFNLSFPPLSLSLLTLAPAAPSLAVVPPIPQAGGQIVIQIQGQPRTRYFLQNSADLISWTTVVTNTLAGSTLNVTNPVPAGSARSFWRAVWEP